MQRLRAAQHGGHRLNRGADDVVLRLLRGQRGSGGLGVEAQHPRARILRLEVLAHDARPHAARGAELRDFFQKIAVRIEEERQPRSELVDVEAGLDRRFDIGHAVAERECDFLHGGRSGFAHVVAGDRNRVPLGHVLVGPGKHVGDDAHGLLRRINISPARDVLLQHVVLHGAGKLADVAALPPRHGDVQRQQNRCRRIDGHRCGNLGQFDAIEQALHVFDGIDGDADLADFAHGQRMIGVEADLRGQIKGNRESGRSIRQQIFVALVRFLGVAHAGVLAHGPEAAAVHGGLHAAREGIFARDSRLRFRSRCL